MQCLTLGAFVAVRPRTTRTVCALLFRGSGSPRIGTCTRHVGFHEALAEWCVPLALPKIPAMFHLRHGARARPFTPKSPTIRLASSNSSSAGTIESRRVTVERVDNDERCTHLNRTPLAVKMSTCNRSGV